MSQWNECGIGGRGNILESIVLPFWNSFILQKPFFPPPCKPTYDISAGGLRRGESIAIQVFDVLNCRIFLFLLWFSGSQHKMSF